ncbi:hypothetical protein EU95_0557 [Prochlorococcus marinus str. MIT 9201]|uniref:Uncharacterized protein n=1 Tax=Prochlorococcus marinus str. MIT 9201 TaxID=93057 RepID=A0A0A2A468_PROMR|nr:hypothetical protein [Prochlorococcus marinus]KGF96672.1 hypothetical protein EU95_0557 [Prochlorococcus marinus str. MIT 9201]
MESIEKINNFTKEYIQSFNFSKIYKKNKYINGDSFLDKFLFSTLTGSNFKLEEEKVDLIFTENQWRFLGDSNKIKNSGFIAFMIFDIVNNLSFNFLKHREKEFLKNKSEELFDSLYINGKTAHDSNKKNSKNINNVLNILAMRLYLKSSKIKFDKSDLVQFYSSQMKEGWFPYINPGRFVRHLSKYSPHKLTKIILRDSNPRFFDISHHCYILLCLIKVYSRNNDKKLKKCLNKGLDILNECIINNNLLFKETNTKIHRFCNFGDTTLYYIFLRLTKLAILKGLNYNNDSIEKVIIKIKKITNINESSIMPIEKESPSFGYVLPALWMDEKYKLIHLKILLDEK